MNMIYATDIPKRERKRALRGVYAIEPVAPKFNPWSSFPITFDRRPDHIDQHIAKRKQPDIRIQQHI